MIRLVLAGALLGVTLAAQLGWALREELAYAPQLVHVEAQDSEHDLVATAAAICIDKGGLWLARKDGGECWPGENLGVHPRIGWRTK